MALNLTIVGDDEEMPVAEKGIRVSEMWSPEVIQQRYDGEYTGDEQFEYVLLRLGYVMMGKDSRDDGRVMKHYIKTHKGKVYQIWVGINK